jgi:hypothetical protein
MVTAAEALQKAYPHNAQARISHDYAHFSHARFVLQYAAITGDSAQIPAAVDEIEKACEPFDRLARTDPENVWWKLVSLDCANWMGDGRMKLHLYGPARDALARGAHLVDQMVQTDGGYTLGYRELARLEMKMGDSAWDEAAGTDAPADRAQLRAEARRHYALSDQHWAAYWRIWPAATPAPGRDEYEQAKPKLAERLAAAP